MNEIKKNLKSNKDSIKNEIKKNLKNTDNNSIYNELGKIHKYEIEFQAIVDKNLRKPTLSVLVFNNVTYSPASISAEEVKKLLKKEIEKPLVKALKEHTKINVDEFIKSFNAKYKNVLTLVSIHSIEILAVLQKEYEKSNTKSDSDDKEPDTQKLINKTLSKSKKETKKSQELEM